MTGYQRKEKKKKKQEKAIDDRLQEKENIFLSCHNRWREENWLASQTREGNKKKEEVTHHRPKYSNQSKEDTQHHHAYVSITESMKIDKKGQNWNPSIFIIY